MIANPAYIMKRELLRVPFWGWWAWKSDSIFVSREATAALRQIAKGGAKAVAQGRPIVTSPRARRRPPGAPPDYKGGIAYLYGELGIPVVPMALNSGFYWPRRRFLRIRERSSSSSCRRFRRGLAGRVFLTGSSAKLRRRATGSSLKPMPTGRGRHSPGGGRPAGRAEKPNNPRSLDFLRAFFCA